MPEINSNNPFAYLGVNPIATPDFKKVARDPTSADRKNMHVGQLWLNTVNNKVWMLAQIVGNTSTWIDLVNSGILINSYVTDSGTASPSSFALNLVGDGTFLSTTGSGSTATVEFIATEADNGQLLIAATAGTAAWTNLASAGGTVNITNAGNAINLEDAGPFVTAISGDTGTAYQSGNNIQIASGSSLTTSGAGLTVTIDFDSSIAIASDFTLSALGAGIIQTNASGLWLSSNGTDGQLMIGGGTEPVWTALNSSDSSLTITNGVNSIDLTIPSRHPTSYAFQGFYAQMTTSHGSVTGGGYEYSIPFNLEGIDQGGCFSSTTFTAPETGIYYLYLFVELRGDASSYWRTIISVNGFKYYGITTPTQNRYSGFQSSIDPSYYYYDLCTGHAFCLVYMTAGQTALGLVQGGGGSKYDDLMGYLDSSTGMVRPYFMGYLMNNI